MKTRRIQWIGMAMVAGMAIGVSTVSCEDPSIWSVQKMVGLIPAECNANIDCDDKNDCTEDTCNAAGLCEYLILTEAPSCDDGNICTRDFCDPYGRCQNEVDTSQTDFTDNPCIILSCEVNPVEPPPLPAPEAMPKPLADGEKCINAQGEAGYCFQAQCYTCKDGVMNGDETGIDCGGQNCPPCKKGEMCNQDSECLSGYCVDGTCCDAACDFVCYSCNLPGSVGTCAPVAFGGTDINPDPIQDCVGTHQCNGGGACVGLIDVPCVSNAECLTDFCYTNLGVCKQKLNFPCTIPGECHTNICSNSVCTPIALDGACTYSDQCAVNHICYSTPPQPICKIEDGKPCATNTECATGYCNQTCMKTPNLSDCIYDDQCQSGYCYTTPIPSFCALPLGADCANVPANTCKTAYCEPLFKKCALRKVGWWCAYDDQCNTGKCINNICTP